MDQPREKRPHSATPYEYVAPRPDTPQTELSASPEYLLQLAHSAPHSKHRRYLRPVTTLRRQSHSTEAVQTPEAGSRFIKQNRSLRPISRAVLS